MRTLFRLTSSQPHHSLQICMPEEERGRHSGRCPLWSLSNAVAAALQLSHPSLKLRNTLLSQLRSHSSQNVFNKTNEPFPQRSLYSFSARQPCRPWTPALQHEKQKCRERPLTRSPSIALKRSAGTHNPDEALAAASPTVLGNLFLKQWAPGLLLPSTCPAASRAAPLRCTE